MKTIEQHRQQLGAEPLCQALGVPRAAFYRQLDPKASAADPTPRPQPGHALSLTEQQTVLATLHEQRFVDRAPAQIYAQLLQEGIYHCSIRTLYRILADHQEVRERRTLAARPVYAKPELLATQPNQVWSWDITKLKGPAKWTYFYLYVILDIFSRYVVGWMVAPRESTELAKRLIGESCRKQMILPSQLTLHADRGSSMKSNGVAQLLVDLGVTKTHSRPQVSNDNPFSESQFKTMKYRPEFPQRFGCLQDARSFGVEFFQWYNHEHRHCGIALYTPADVHYGRIEQIRQLRQATLDAAYLKNPNRFRHKPPMAEVPPTAVWINPPQNPQKQATD